MVQILMSTYNGEEFLEEQLESLFNQTYSKIKILIRDDGSKDNTVEIIKKYQNYKNFHEIELIEGKNIGVIASFFNLIKKSDNKSNYFAFCDQDDYWEPQKIQRAIEKIEQEESSGEDKVAYCSNLKLVDKKLNFIKYQYNKELKPSFENAVVENIITGCTLVINKRMKEILLKEIDKVNTKEILMHDWYIYILASASGKVVYDSNSYIKYRQHENNVVGMALTKKALLKRRIMNFKKYKGCRKRHIMEISKNYCSILNEKQKKMILNLSKDRIFSGIKRQSPIMTILTNILILLKQY